MSAAKARLGRYLFYDKRLSVNGTLACASCHKQEFGFTNGAEMPRGATGEAHPRKAITLVNAAYSATLGWSNPNLKTLEQQALVPMLAEHPVELGLKGRDAEVTETLRSDALYAQLFPESFPGVKNPFSVADAVKAIASFERTIISARSPYDRYHYGETARFRRRRNVARRYFSTINTAVVFDATRDSILAMRRGRKRSFTIPRCTICRRCSHIQRQMWGSMSSRGARRMWGSLKRHRCEMWL